MESREQGECCSVQDNHVCDVACLRTSCLKISGEVVQCFGTIRVGIRNEGKCLSVQRYCFIHVCDVACLGESRAKDVCKVVE
jgi:hypothetical protein